VIVLEIQRLALSFAKEKDFAQDFLAFASKRHGASVTQGWKVLVQHVSDMTRWNSLYNVARYAGQDPFTWGTCDCWSFAWDEPIAGTWVHVKNTDRRRQLAERTELLYFDPSIATKALQHDLLIFVNDSLTSLSVHDLGLGYIFYLIAHECLHWVSDWTSKELVRDGVPPKKDRIVVSTLDTFLRSLSPELIAQRYF